MILEKVLVLSIICSNCKNEDEKLFKKEESIEISKVLGVIENIYNYFKGIAEENINEEFRLKNINDTTHRANICSWNIWVTFSWYIPKIFGKSSL